MTTTQQPYTEEDLRREATRQYADILRNPDRLEVQDEMHCKPIPSTTVDLEPATGEPLEMSRAWHHLPTDDFHDAANEVHELLEGAVDVSRWSIDLGACALRQTTELAWGHGTAWDLAVQIAHRPGLSDDLRAAITTAVQDAVTRTLHERGIDHPLAHNSTTEQRVPR
ncbi:hypothetical protein ACFVY4_27080 [Streptomyces sp. NPDC058299]|uniref:hypothetical protein n=1 Tax=Streptomyces sp. NPDC058299 TaxID=3346435 RepID=UPI0036E195A2